MLKAREGQTGYDIREIYEDGTDILRMRQIRLNGKLHSPRSDKPSHEAYDELGRRFFSVWHKDNLEHREDGPSTISLNRENGIVETERYFLLGQPRPTHLGPCVINRDPDTGEIFRTLNAEEWYEKKFERDKPSLEP